MPICRQRRCGHEVRWDNWREATRLGTGETDNAHLWNLVLRAACERDRGRHPGCKFRYRLRSLRMVLRNVCRVVWIRVRATLARSELQNFDLKHSATLFARASLSQICGM